MKKGVLVIIAVAIGLGAYLYSNVEPEKDYFTTKDLLQERVKKKQKRNKMGVRKFDNPSAYTYYHDGIRTRENELSPSYPFNYKNLELTKAKRNQPKQLRTAALQFTERGPVNTPGRSRSIVVMPDDPNYDTWISGTVGGGIWKTTDAGATWVNTTPELPSLAITSIDYAKSNPQILYASTGEAIGGSVGLIGSGVYKSVDGGDSWSQLSSTTDKAFSIIHRVAVDPANPSVVFICTSNGYWDRDFRSSIYRSLDGGESWEVVYQSEYWISQIVFNQKNPNTIYGTLWFRGTLKSTDGGENWEIKDNGFSNVTGRIEIAMAPTDTSWLYASAVGDANSVNYDLYVSMDAGESWKLVDQKYKTVRKDLLGGQGNYDNTVAVDPFNKRIAYFGGVDLWKTEIGEEETEEFRKSASMAVSNGDTSYWEFINFGADFSDGKLDLGTRISLADFSSVNVVTGPGISQKAHRFVVDKAGAGVPDNDYSYEDYVEVPFQVWDVENNVQLMVSFRDQQEDGDFTLKEENTAPEDDANHSREYLFIHDVVYSETANSEIAQDGGLNKGHTYRQMYFFWPVLHSGELFDPENPEMDTIKIRYQTDTLTLRSAALSNVSDAYDNYDKKNNAYNLEEGTFILHPDHHYLLLLPINDDDSTFQIFDCNDGGLYISNISKTPGLNDGDWTNEGIGINSGQFYSADKKSGYDVYIGGMQDNGTWTSPDTVSADQSTFYSLTLTGDGFETIWNNVDTDLIIASSQFNNFAKTEDGGETWFNASTGIEGEKPFISKLANSSSKPNTLFTVTSLGVYKSSNFGDSWELTPINENWGFSSFLDVDVSRANYNIVWAGSGMSSTQNVYVSTDAGATFESTVNYDQAVLGNLSGMATHPTEDSTAYVLFSFSGGPKILRTEDLGQTWEDISGFGAGSTSTNGFPDVAVYDLLVRPDDPEILWAGTEIGVFESADNGESWTFLDSDLGSTAVWQMKVVDDQIVIATHGRGIWTAQLDEFVEVTLVPELVEGGPTIENDLYLRTRFNSAYDSTLIYANGELIYRIGESEVNTDSVLIIENPALAFDSEYEVLIQSYRNEKPFASDELNIMFFEVEGPIAEYENNFEENEDDFIGNGFSVSSPSAFEGNAIHSLHPYPEGTNFPGEEKNFIYYLKKSIEVGEANTRIKYRDIAIIEPGESGASYGEEGFFDYVVVEGSSNGYEWQSLLPGYDAKSESIWLNAFKSSENGTPAMFIGQEILLNDYFEAGEQVMIRFRLFSDPLTNAWGWAIDDLSIREEPITSLNDISGDQILAFPNPSDGNVTIRIKTNRAELYSFTLTDVNGKVVRKTWQQSMNAVANNEIFISGSDLKDGVYFLTIADGKGQQTIRKLIFR